jgi:hypothetical protein
MRRLAALFFILGTLLVGYSFLPNSRNAQPLIKNIFVKNVDTVTAGAPLPAAGSPQLSQSALPMEVKNNIIDPIQLRYSQLTDCLNSVDEPCQGFAGETFREYYQDVLTTMHLEAKALLEDLKQHADMRLPQYESFARTLLEDSHADMQMVGLEIVSLYPPSLENLSAVSRSLETTIESQYLSRGLKLLENYKGLSSYNSELNRILNTQISTGLDEATSRLATKALFKNLNEKRYHEFSILRDELKANLKSSLGHISKNSQNLLKGRLQNLDSILSEYASLNR